MQQTNITILYLPDIIFDINCYKNAFRAQSVDFPLILDETFRLF